MSPEMVGVLGILVLFILLALRMYIGIAMGVVGLIGSSILVGWESGINLLSIIPIEESMSYTLSVIPLFVLMGQFTFISGISTDIYKTVYTWIGHLRGGLAMATILACSFFAAICGSSLATGATMGMVAIPEMDKYNYDPRLSTGCVAAGGTLGILIPPSIGFVIYGIMTEQSIGKLFMAGILPGVLLSALFIAVIHIQCVRNPKIGPRGPVASWRERFRSLSSTWGMLSLVILVIGGLYFGFFTPTEAAAIGACGAFLIVLLKRRMTVQVFIQCLRQTGKMTAFIFLVVFGAGIFSYFLALTGLPMALSNFITALPFSKHLIFIGIILIYVILGCVMEVYAIMILTLPIIFPIVESLGFDPIWYGVIMVIVLEVGLITPPVGLNVFVIKGAVKDVPLTTIFRGIWPFFFAAILAIVLVTIFPDIALFIPNHM
jgi:C4-dicarboxylate transporter, DctM subunit